MAVFGDSGQQNTYSGIALAHESGKIEMQYFTRNFTVQSSAEEEKLERMMTEAFWKPASNMAAFRLLTPNLLYILTLDKHQDQFINLFLSQSAAVYQFVWYI